MIFDRFWIDFSWIFMVFPLGTFWLQFYSKISFLGNRVRYSVDVKEHVIVVDDNYSAGRRIFEFGQKVVLSLNLRQARMLAE